MGRRGRRKGVTGQALRDAHRGMKERKDRCAAIARHVFSVARELDDAGHPDAALPLPIMAPLTAAAERAAPGAAKLAGLDHEDEATVQDVAAYLVSGFREIAVQLDPEHFKAWRERADEAMQQHAGTARVPPNE